MYRVAMLHAYDALDSVVIACQVKATAGGPSDGLEPELACSVTIQGIGDENPATWLRDALVALAETL